MNASDPLIWYNRITTLAVLRWAVSLLLFTHGAARWWAGGVAPFGDFLTAQGFPFGLALAAGVTGLELVGGALMVANRAVAWLAPAFALQLLAGMVLVHASAGWFVVGLGRNGMEYSALLV
ncbi:MAG: DoxX family protein, partial [Bernardetiaceae bacterium]|nr:DoxX family protein [Bernardetiaceae bacterium]